MSSNPKEAIGSMAIGAIIGGGLFATAIGCGFIVAGPITVPLALGAVLAGGAGGVLFQNIKPAITKVISDANAPNTYIQRNFGGVALSQNSWENLMRKISPSWHN